jgi:hypothetical protein
MVFSEPSLKTMGHYRCVIRNADSFERPVPQLLHLASTRVIDPKESSVFPVSSN